MYSVGYRGISYQCVYNETESNLNLSVLEYHQIADLYTLHNYQKCWFLI